MVLPSVSRSGDKEESAEEAGKGQLGRWENTGSTESWRLRKDRWRGWSPVPVRDGVGKGRATTLGTICWERKCIYLGAGEGGGC